MAEEAIVNGVTSQSDDQTGESIYDTEPRGTDTKVAELTQKIEALEGEKRYLVRENEETKEKINKLNVVIEVLKTDEAANKERLDEMESELELVEEDKQALDAIAARAVELETEVSRLQHDLISAMSETEESNKEVAVLKMVVGEKGEKVLVLEREVEELKNAKAESEKRVRELERKIMVLEVRESEVKSEKVRVKEEMREIIEEKDVDMLGLKKKIEELESVIAKNGLNLEKLKKDKTSVEEALRESKEKARNMELNMTQLQKEVKAAEKVVSGLKERTSETINGVVKTNKDFNGDGEEEEGFLGLQRPAVAIGSAGAIIAAAAVIYAFYGRRN